VLHRSIRRRVLALQSSRHRVEVLESRRLLTAITWDGGGDQTSWNDAANWSDDAVPTAEDDVTIGLGVNDVHIEDVVDAKSVVTSSPISFADESTLRTDYFGTEAGARVTAGRLTTLGDSGRLRIRGAARFDGITLASNWSLNGSLIIVNGMTLNGVVSVGEVGNDGGSLTFTETANQTLAGSGRVELFGIQSGVGLVTSISEERTLVIGPDITIRTTGMRFFGAWRVGFDFDNAPAEIINYGRIESAVAEEQLELYCTNNEVAKFTNHGIISVTNGAIFRTTGTFTTTAPIQVENGNVYLAGQTDASAVNLIQRTGPGRTTIAGAMDLAGSAMNLSAVTGSVEVVAFATISGPGSINTSGGAALLCGMNASPSRLSNLTINGTVKLGSGNTQMLGTVTLAGTITGVGAQPLQVYSPALLVAADGARLSNVAGIDGTVAVNADGARLFVDGGMSRGTVRLDGVGAKVVADGTQTWTNVTTSFLKANTGIVIKGDAAKLTLGTGCVVGNGSGSIVEDPSNAQPASLINQGIIRTDGARTIQVTLPGGISNVGTLQADTGGAIIFNGPFSQTAGSIIINGGSVTSSSLMNVTGGSYIVRRGTHVFNATAFTSTAPLNVMVESTGQLTFADAQTLLASLALRQTGKVTVGAGGNRVLRVGSLSFLNTARLDLNDNALIVDHAAGSASPINAIRSSVVSGYAAGAWNGTGIMSTTAGATPGTAIGFAESSAILGAAGGTFAGQEVDGSAVLLRYTRLGDTDLDRDVDLSDLGNMASNFGATSSKFWNDGDLDFDGDVDLNDLGSLATNFGTTLSVGKSQTAATMSTPAGSTQRGVVSRRQAYITS
jgi:hypothetical protein